MDQTKKREEAVGKFFNREAKRWGKRQDKGGIPYSAMKHVDAMVDNNVSSVIDVGAGPGIILLEMMDKGVERGVAIDLSREMCVEAERRVKNNELEDRVEVIHGSFLEMDAPRTEGVSLHMVLCCHPDREAMLRRSMKNDPKIVVLTVPRSFWIVRHFVNLVMNVKDFFSKGFRFYVHEEADIITQMDQGGYKLVDRISRGFTVTLVFSK